MTKKQKTKKAKPKNKAWFISVRGSYLPNSTAGWLTYIPYIAYILAVFYIAINETDSYGLAVLYIVPNLIAAIIVMTYIAAKRS